VASPKSPNLQCLSSSSRMLSGLISLQIKDMCHMLITIVIFSMTIHYRLSEAYNLLCHHKFQRRMYIHSKVTFYLSHCAVNEKEVKKRTYRYIQFH
jgi:hypothetical protein